MNGSPTSILAIVIPDVMTLAKSLCGGIAGGSPADHARDCSESASRECMRRPSAAIRLPQRRELPTIEMIEAEGLLARAQDAFRLFSQSI